MGRQVPHDLLGALIVAAMSLSMVALTLARA